jgi:hypothetical protein
MNRLPTPRGVENESRRLRALTRARRPTAFAAPSLPLYAGTARRLRPIASPVDHILLFWDRQLFGTATRVFYVDQCADLQKCYPVKLGEALPWCRIRVLQRGTKAWRGFAQMGEGSTELPLPCRPTLTQEAWAFAHPAEREQRYQKVSRAP